MTKKLYIASDTLYNYSQEAKLPEFLKGVFNSLRLITSTNEYVEFILVNTNIVFTETAYILNTFKKEGILFSNEIITIEQLQKLISYKDVLVKDVSVDFENSEILSIILDESLDTVSLRSDKKVLVNSWEDAIPYLISERRIGSVERNTYETKINVKVDLDGKGKADINTGLGFFDHMLEQIAKHGNIGISIKVDGDLHVDEHHTIEDTAIALGEALSKAVGNKLGMDRYGFALPMDDCSAQVLLDFGGRPWLVWEADFKREKVGDMPTEMFYHFFKSLADASKCNLNIKAEGANEHHKIEGVFKAYARALKMAIQRNFNQMVLPTTKGLL